MQKKYMPTLILTIISVIVSGLVVLAYNVTYEDTTGVLTTKLEDACVDIFGESEYEIITRTAEDGTVSPLQYDKVINVIVDKINNNLLLEVTTDGYSKEGIDVVVGFDKDGNVAGVRLVSFKDMPGISKKKRQPYLDKFDNANKSTDVESIDGITGATYSSNGIKDAIEIAINTYNENKEEILSE